MNDNWTDKLIDVHLEAPNSTEPQLGFESRLLARLAEEQTTRRRPMFWMIWASAAVATALIAIVFFARPRSNPTPVETAKVIVPEQPPRVAAPAPSTGSPTVKRAGPARPRRQIMPAVASDIRQEVFPAPFPLSEQERLAFAYLRGTPRSEVIAISHPEQELQELDELTPGPETNPTLPSFTR
jgi:hypothetical protein